MGLTADDKKEIQDIIRSALQSSCECDLSADTRAEVGHFFGRLKDHGGGNLNQGIEEFSKSIAFITRIRRHGERIGGAVSVALVISVLTSLLGVFLLGVKAWVSMCKGGS